MKILEKVIDMCCTLHPGSSDHSTSGKNDHKNEDVMESKPSKFTIPQVAKGDFSPKETKYENVKFAKLPVDAQNAVIALGFNATTWDESGRPASESKWWEDLSPEERKAAETLGWDIKAWDDKYEESNFGDLPPHVAKAATAIGFTAEMWDGNRLPGFEHKCWKELSEKEQIALNVLGWTEWKWDHSP